jgi:hypothetical protein
MLIISSKSADPPGSWRWKVPKTGYVVSAGNWTDFLHRAKMYCLANAIPMGEDFEERVQGEMCEQNNWGPYTCEYVEAGPPKPQRSLNANDLRNFLAVLSGWLGTRELVPQEEAERRSAICAACPRNVAVAGCYGCQGIVSIISQVVGRRNTEHDNKLQGCSVCGCENRAQVHVPLDVLAKGVTPEMKFPEWCWKANCLNPQGEQP